MKAQFTNTKVSVSYEIQHEPKQVSHRWVGDRCHKTTKDNYEQYAPCMYDTWMAHSLLAGKSSATTST